MVKGIHRPGASGHHHHLGGDTIRHGIRTLRRRLTGSPAPLTEQARAAGWHVGRAARAFLADLDACLARRGGRVAVLDGPQGSPVADLLAGHPHVRRLDEYDVDRADLHAALTAAGPYDVIVDDTPRRPGHADLFRSTFLHTRRGGAYLVRHAEAPARDRSGDDLPDLLAGLMLKRLRPARRRGRRWPSADDRLAATLGRLEVRSRHALAVNRVAACVKLREEETNRLFDADTLSGGVLTTIPPTRLVSRADVRESPSPRNGTLPTEYDVPALSLRLYEDVTCAPGQVAWTDRLILPDTFRHNQRVSLGNKNLHSVTRRFARRPHPRGPVEHLDGSYFYLDNEIRGHYGHALTEQVSLLWAWRKAKEADPSLKALLLHRNRDLAQFEVDLYAAAGIELHDLAFHHTAVQVDRLYAATPMFSQPEYVHPDLPAVWAELSGNLACRAPDRDYPHRIFLSRRKDKRGCHNGAEVEALFTSYGFTVLFPEDYPLAEQVRLFREAEVIAGYAGSAMFTIALAAEPKHVIMVSSESYTAKNEAMICAALGHRLDVAWCEADRPLGSRWDRRIYHSPFTFDRTREGAWLTSVLDDLP